MAQRSRTDRVAPAARASCTLDWDLLHRFHTVPVLNAPQIHAIMEGNVSSRKGVTTMATRWILLGVLLSLPAPLAAQDGAKSPPLPEAAIARYGSPRMRHPEEVRRVLWLPDQKRVVTRTQNHVFL